MTTERSQLIAEVWRYLPFYQPGSPKIADEQVPVPVELLERVLKALADPSPNRRCDGCELNDALPEGEQG